MLTLPAPLVSTAWLARHLGQVRVVDASWHMPALRRDAWAEYRAGHIPGATFFDIDEHSDPHSPLPHMLPTAEDFAQAVSAMGIASQDAVVVYDASGLFSAARLWWMFRVFGHGNVAVLDGGLPKWLAEQHPVDTTATHPDTTNSSPAIFHATLQPQWLRNKQDVLHAVTHGSAVVLDARAAARFAGEVPEPRAGLRSGHIPSSHNLPFTALLAADSTLLPPEQLRQILSLTEGKTVISSCGSGVTACILDLALESLGHPDHAVYDGAWAEWGADDSGCPVTTGAA